MNTALRVGIALLFASFVLVCSGCKGEKARISMENSALHSAYITKMEKGETTPEQDKRFIKASGKVALELDRSIRGTKKANSTWESAKRLSESDIDPDSDMDLD